MALSFGKWILALDGSSLPDRNLIGGKAWSIASMSRLGLNVPPSIVITTRACTAYLQAGRLPDGLVEELAAALAWLEERTGRSFGKGPHPLLVSVRSGAPISMPGMMDTVLNLGINDVTEAALAKEFGDSLFARDTHRRFLDLYASIVLKADVLSLDPQADPENWRQSIQKATGTALSQNVLEHLDSAIRAVFDSWYSRRAKRYRQHHDIPEELGTAVTVQAMIFGNMDARSGTGVLFSRNPLTGDPVPFGEYLARAQGEDLVSGKHTPHPFAKMKETVPEAYEDLLAAAKLLEEANGDIQDIEFTVEKGKLYLLQTRSAKRAPKAAVRIAVDMVREGKISPDVALERVTAEQARVLLSPRLADGAADAATILARGEGASHGIGIGVIVTDSDEAEHRAKAGEAVILARATTSPNDIHGMIAARAIITEQGGSTSHAAVVSRALGRPSVVGCGAGNLMSLAGREVTVDGQTGLILDGRLAVVITDETADDALAQLTKWAEERSSIAVERTAPKGVEMIDLDQTSAAEDPALLPEILKGLAGSTAIGGGLMANDAAVFAAVDAGVKLIIANPRLPVLLAILQAQENRAADNKKEMNRG